MHNKVKARYIRLQGLVQGVGFRPFVYKLACHYDLKGWVKNTNEGVFMQVEGQGKTLDQFLEELLACPPKASAIHFVEQKECAPEYFSDFRILKSRDASDRITRVSPDIAVCNDCLEDMRFQPHRLAYPFVNCTHCGPRFTIIRELPYDRDKTTMEPFVMCETCRREYEDVNDRRFHAQPVACNVCGPEYTLIRGDRHIKEPEAILQTCVDILDNGGIIAIKGLGGFHLMCDAGNEEAVARLRAAKHRDDKPFAVMAKDVETASYYAQTGPAEAEELTSWHRPIVLLKQRHALARSINPGCATLGMMLPYMPVHFQLFEKSRVPVWVMTSGNLSDEPIVTDNVTAQVTFRDKTDAVLVYNRDIHNRTDDSIAFVVRGKARMIRRSRGYVPEPIELSFPADGILAAGAELNHCFAMGKDNEALLSQHIGDLKRPETYAFFEETVSRFGKLFRVQPAYVACDLHPDYLSTQYARSLALPLIPVQHHHAHIAACMAEHHLEEPVAGVCWDGTGLGTDGHIWGGEFMVAGLKSFKRYARFEYIPLPGGDKAAHETWRTGISWLYQVYGEDFLNLDLPFARELRKRPETGLILQAIDRKLNTPLTSSAGRLFDAVAAITGVCNYNTYHAEAPMRLEAILEDSVDERYPYSIERADAPGQEDFTGDTVSVNGSTMTDGIPADYRPEEAAVADEPNELNAAGKPEVIISFRPMIRAIVVDVQAGVPVPVISARFHNTLVEVIARVTGDMKHRFNTGNVVLTGGVFQNRYLLERAEERLELECNVFSPERVPSNDAGIALGQLAIAAQKIRREKKTEQKNSLNRPPSMTRDQRLSGVSMADRLQQDHIKCV